MPALPFVPAVPYFNSRPHEEVDPSWLHASGSVPVISTHDLTKRSTIPLLQVSLNCLPFQLTTSRRGRRSPAFVMPSSMWLFQLTTSRRGRRLTLEIQLTTSRRGRLSVRGGSCCRGRISTHDLTKRSTAKLHILFLTFAFIISTLHK